MSERPVSAFSRAFAAHLRGVMAERDIAQTDVARVMGRSKGYVSEHSSGRRAVDSDLLDAVAEVAGIDTRDLIAEIARRMAVPTGGRDSDVDQGVEEYRQAYTAALDRRGVEAAPSDISQIHGDRA